MLGKQCVVLLLSAAACTGQVGNVEVTSDPGPTGGGSQGGAGGVTPSAVVLPAAGVFRLTAAQYKATLRDLLGDEVPMPTLERDIVLKGFAAVGAAGAGIAESAAESFEGGGSVAAAFAFGAKGSKRSLLTCAGQMGPDEACVKTFVQSFGRKVFRRPLESAEQDNYVKVWKDAAALEKSSWRGVELLVAAMLQSPNFLFRVQEGEVDPGNRARRRYRSFEMADRLSYFLWGSTPDDALLNAAESGALLSAAGVAAQAKRLAASPRARAALANFVAEKLDLGQLDLISKDAVAFPRFSPALAATMKASTQRLIDFVLFEKSGDFLDLIDTRTTFVNKELAAIYNIPNITSDTLVQATAEPLRVGILGQASFLAVKSHAVKTSPTQRGKFVMERLLCNEIPAPDASVDTTVPADANLSMRDFLEEHRKNPTCASCHKLMDPIGVAFENFDAIGAFRTKDAGREIDASGAIEGKAYRNLPELAAVLRSSPEVAMCVVKDLLRYATADSAAEQDPEVIAELTKTFEANGRQLRDLAAAIATSDSFRFASSF
ncbi:MAG: DUF1592 domain-containing protein [Deltaproteobacteria bacterium]|nr:DUF1592 domain-containing protein [Deltaproteobacteria bacterium]